MISNSGLGARSVNNHSTSKEISIKKTWTNSKNISNFPFLLLCIVVKLTFLTASWVVIYGSRICLAFISGQLCWESKGPGLKGALAKGAWAKENRIDHNGLIPTKWLMYHGWQQRMCSGHAAGIWQWYDRCVRWVGGRVHRNIVTRMLGRQLGQYICQRCG